MKRNLDLLREILLVIEDFEPNSIGELQDISPTAFTGTDPQNLHHIYLIIQAGFINQVGEPILQGEFSVSGLTLQGHDFLDAIREYSIWNSTKRRIFAAGGWTLDLVLAVAKDEIQRRLAGGLGV